jgi:hypothetical protein
MDKLGNNLEKERIKINLSFGILAMSIGLISLVKNFVNTSGYSKYIHLLVGSTFGAASVFLILYIVFTAARYKSREVGEVDDFYVSNGTTNFFYDEAINIFAVGFFVTFGSFILGLSLKLCGMRWVGWVLGGLILIIFFIGIYLLSGRAKKIDKIK